MRPLQIGDTLQIRVRSPFVPYVPAFGDLRPLEVRVETVTIETEEQLAKYRAELNR